MVWVWGGWMKHNGVLPVGMQVYITCITCILMYWPSWLLYAALKSKFQNGLFVAKMARSCLHILFFQIHLLGPIMHHLTKPHDFKFVVWSSGIQNKEPSFTVYPLYTKDQTKAL
jgi:hypothetical protein